MSKVKNPQPTALDDLIQALLLLEDTNEAERFLKDLCTPQELTTLAERWRVCRMLNNTDLSYREIHEATGASLATITRVARFLKTEPHQGYMRIINKISKHKKALT